MNTDQGTAPEEMSALDKLFAQVADMEHQMELADQAAAAIAKDEKNQEAKKKSTGRGRPKKGRERGVDTALTKGNLYRVMDATERKAYFIVGIGATETVIDDLLAKGHTLLEGLTTEPGFNPDKKKLIHSGIPYICLLSRQNKDSTTVYYQPGMRGIPETWSFEIINPVEGPGYGLIDTVRWDGMVCFEMVTCDSRDGEMTLAGPGLGTLARRHADEITRDGIANRIYEKTSGRKVINHVEDVPALLDIICALTDITFSEDAKRQVADHLREQINPSRVLPKAGTTATIDEINTLRRSQTARA